MMDSQTKQVQVKNQLGHLLRALDLAHNQLIEIHIISDGQYIMLRVSNYYDLVNLIYVWYYLQPFSSCYSLQNYPPYHDV